MPGRPGARRARPVARVHDARRCSCRRCSCALLLSRQLHRAAVTAGPRAGTPSTLASSSPRRSSSWRWRCSWPLRLAGAAHGAPLEAPADPMGDYPARPEWYLLPLFQLRKLLPRARAEFLGHDARARAGGGYLALLPLDRPSRAARAPVFVFAPVVAHFGGARRCSAGRRGARTRATRCTPSSARKADRGRADGGEARPRGRAAGGGAGDGARPIRSCAGASSSTQHCASCHVLGDLGDPEKATATKLDGWGTPKWIAAMIHDPDAPEFFGRGPFKGKMPSVDMRPKDKPRGRAVEADGRERRGEGRRRRVPRLARRRAGRSRRAPLDAATRALGEKIVARPVHRLPPVQGRRRRRGLRRTRRSSRATARSRGRGRRWPTRPRPRRTGTRRSTHGAEEAHAAVRQGAAQPADVDARRPLDARARPGLLAR